MTFEQKIAWAETHDIESVRLFHTLDRYGFFDSNLSIWAGYDFLLDIRAGNIRHVGRKTLQEFERALAFMLCEQCTGKAKVKALKEYDGAEAILHQRHDTLMVLREYEIITPEELEELYSLSEYLYPSPPPWEQ